MPPAQATLAVIESSQPYTGKIKLTLYFHQESTMFNVTIGLNKNGFFGKLIDEQSVDAAFFSVTPDKSRPKCGNITVSEAERLYSEGMAEHGSTQIKNFRFSPWDPDLPKFHDFVSGQFGYHPDKYWGWTICEWAEYLQILFSDGYEASDSWHKDFQEHFSQIGDCISVDAA
jgi:hypothetical protein